MNAQGAGGFGRDWETGNGDSMKEVELGPGPARGEGTRAVRLVEAPVELYLDHFSALDDLVRELQTMRVGHESGSVPVPGRLLELIEAVLGEYHGTWERIREQGRRALDGAATGRVTVALWLPPDAGAAARRIFDLVEEAESYCRSGRLLALPAGEEVWRLRRWLRDEIVAQTEGGSPPTPFDGVRR